MRRDGIDWAAIVSALTMANQTQCKPPLPDNEVQRIAKSVGGYASVGHYLATDDGNALRLVDELGLMDDEFPEA